MRSKKLESQKTKLELREAKLKGELSETSEEFENHMKRLGMIVLVSGVGLWVAYKAFSHFTSDGKSNQESDTSKHKVELEKNIEVKQSSAFSLKNMLLERLVASIVKVGTAQLAEFLAKKMATDNEVEEDSN